MEIEVKLPDGQQPIKFLAEVAWSWPLTTAAGGVSKRSFVTGLKFVSIEPKDRDVIMQYARLNELPPTD